MPLPRWRQTHMPSSSVGYTLCITSTQELLGAGDQVAVVDLQPSYLPKEIAQPPCSGVICAGSWFMSPRLLE